MAKKLITFREWSENFAKINFNLVGWAEITCRLNNQTLLYTRDENVSSKIKHEPSKILYDLYKVNFNQIQFNYQSILDEFDNTN